MINIYFQKIGEVDNHQHEIVSADMKWTDTYNPWKFTKASRSQKQRFNALVNVEFYELDRGVEFFVPKTPDLVEPVGWNFLYPF